jgi:hypothetical protein
MKVFISWSGEQGREIGEVFWNWLPGVLQAMKPYFSPDDIAKGALWERDIAKELDTGRSTRPGLFQAEPKVNVGGAAHV